MKGGTLRPLRPTWHKSASGVADTCTQPSDIRHSRTGSSALTGVCAGILGLTSFYGFALYVVASMVLSVMPECCHAAMKVLIDIC